MEALSAPPPIPKTNHQVHGSLSDDLPPPPPTFVINNGRNTVDAAVNALSKRRQAIYGHDSTSDDSSSFSSDDSDNNDQENSIFKPVPATRSRVNSVRSRASGYRSTRESRSRPGSPMTLPRRKSCAGLKEFENENYFEAGRGQRYSTATAITGYETQPEFQPNEGTISRLIKRRKSLKSLGSLTTHLQQLVGQNEPTSLSGLNSEKLIFW